MLSGVFAFSWGTWSTSPTLGRLQFVMRAATCVDQGGAGTEQEVRRSPYSFPLSSLPSLLLLPPSLPASSLPLPFLQPAWFLMVGVERSFKLALTEKDEEFSNELREDCEERGMVRSGGERDPSQ